MLPRNNRHNGRTWVEIDLDNLAHNFRCLKTKVGADTKVMVAVKADAYGHGAIQVSKTLAQEGVDMFGTASLDEALELKNKGVATPIVILSPTTFDLIPEIAENDFRPNVSNLEYASRLSETGERAGKEVKVHIEVDTGMGRTGFPVEDALSKIQAISGMKNINIEGIFTHFPNAEEDSHYASAQIEKFNELIKKLEEEGIHIELKHTANSAAILTLPQSYMNMVRPGLILYGLFPSKGLNNSLDIKPVMNFKTRIVQLQTLPEGRSISYGRRYFTKRKMKIATISVGYGDGYFRSLSNKGNVIIRGKRSPIVGVVCMDLTMVDVTDIERVEIGDEVTLIGEDGKERITPEEIAELTETISYEVTSCIGPRVPRIFLKDGKTLGVKSLLGEDE